MNWPAHGGQPQYMKALFNMDPDHSLIDFSANLNPLGAPPWLEEAWMQAFRELDTYPDPNYMEAREAIARQEGVSRDETLLTNGGAEAIFLVAKMFESRRALVVQPTFLEYERALAHYHVVTEHVFLEEREGFAFPLQKIVSRLKGADVVFLCRPNNPTGTAAEEAQVEVLLEASRREGVTVVIDEAFADMMTGTGGTLTAWVSRYPHLILLRSLTKMFTVPGLRIGYIIASERWIASLREVQLPWSVNAAAAYLVPLLLKDKGHIERTKAWLEQELAFVSAELAKLHLYRSPTVTNFYLLQDPLRPGPDDTLELFQFLLERGVLARHTDNFRGLDGRYLRLAVRSRGENERLLFHLRQWRDER